MAMKNKIANTVADLNYEYLSIVAKLCGVPVDSLIDRMARPPSWSALQLTTAASPVVAE